MLTVKQAKFLTELLSCGTVATAIKNTGISSRTAYIWLKEPGFKEELQKRKAEMINSVVLRMQVGFSDAAEELLKIIRKEDVSDQVKINAVTALFQIAKPLAEQAEILTRLDAIEQKMKGGG